MRAFLISTAAVLMAGTAIASPVTVYSENFDDVPTSGNGISVSNFGWEAHRGGNGARTGSGNDAANWGGDPLASGGAGGGRQIRVVPDAAAHTPPARIYSFFQSAEDVLVWTDEFSAITLSNYSTLDVSFAHRADTGVAFRAAVRINDGVNDTWYASNILANGTGSGTVWTVSTANVLGAQWSSFAFSGTQTTSNPGPFDATGSFDGALPAGTITAAGIYYQMPNGGNARYDSFLIQGTLIPEPASLAFLAAAPLLLGRRRR